MRNNRAVINAKNSSEPFYHKFKKVLGIVVICKTIILFILYTIQASLYFALSLYQVVAACVVVVILVFIFLIVLFTFLSVKVNGILHKHPTLSIVRTKVNFLLSFSKQNRLSQQLE